MTDQARQPVPFELVEQDGVRVASNGQVRLSLLDAGGRLFRRRGVSGLPMKPAAEVLVPQLNALAGELLQHPDISAQDAVARLLAIAGTVPTAEPQRHEWAVAELGAVLVYTDGRNIVVTKQDLLP